MEQLAEYLEIAPITLEHIKKSTSYEDYRKIEATYKVNRREKQKKEKKETIVRNEQSVTIVANQYMAEQLKRQTELLTLISNKLAFIVEELCPDMKKEEERKQAL